MSRGFEAVGLQVFLQGYHYKALGLKVCRALGFKALGFGVSGGLWANYGGGGARVDMSGGAELEGSGA